MKTFNNIKSNRQPSPDYINVTLHASIRGVYKHFHKCSMHQYNHVPSFKNPFEGKEQNMEKCWKWLDGVFMEKMVRKVEKIGITMGMMVKKKMME